MKKPPVLKKPGRKPEKNPDGTNKPFWAGNYDDSLPQKLFDHLSRGYSFMSFGAEVRAGISTLYEWLEKHEEFRLAKEAGEAAGLRMYEQVTVAKMRGTDLKGPDGSVVLEAKKVDAGVAQFLLRTRFARIYGDKKEIDHKSSDGSMKPTFIFKEVGDGEDD